MDIPSLLSKERLQYEDLEALLCLVAKLPSKRQMGLPRVVERTGMVELVQAFRDKGSLAVVPFLLRQHSDYLLVSCVDILMRDARGLSGVPEARFYHTMLRRLLSVAVSDYADDVIDSIRTLERRQPTFLYTFLAAALCSGPALYFKSETLRTFIFATLFHILLSPDRRALHGDVARALQSNGYEAFRFAVELFSNMQTVEGFANTLPQRSTILDTLGASVAPLYELDDGRLLVRVSEQCSECAANPLFRSKAFSHVSLLLSLLPPGQLSSCEAPLPGFVHTLLEAAATEPPLLCPALLVALLMPEPQMPAALRDILGSLDAEAVPALLARPLSTADLVQHSCGLATFLTLRVRASSNFLQSSPVLSAVAAVDIARMKMLLQPCAASLAKAGLPTDHACRGFVLLCSALCAHVGQEEDLGWLSLVLAAVERAVGALLSDKAPLAPSEVGLYTRVLLSSAAQSAVLLQHVSTTIFTECLSRDFAAEPAACALRAYACLSALCTASENLAAASAFEVLLALQLLSASGRVASHLLGSALESLCAARLFDGHTPSGALSVQALLRQLLASGGSPGATVPLLAGCIADADTPEPQVRNCLTALYAYTTALVRSSVASEGTMLASQLYQEFARSKAFSTVVDLSLDDLLVLSAPDGALSAGAEAALQEQHPEKPGRGDDLKAELAYKKALRAHEDLRASMLAAEQETRRQLHDRFHAFASVARRLLRLLRHCPLAISAHVYCRLLGFVFCISETLFRQTLPPEAGADGNGNGNGDQDPPAAPLLNVLPEALPVYSSLVVRIVADSLFAVYDGSKVVPAPVWNLPLVCTASMLLLTPPQGHLQAALASPGISADRTRYILSLVAEHAASASASAPASAPGARASSSGPRACARDGPAFSAGTLAAHRGPGAGPAPDAVPFSSWAELSSQAVAALLAYIQNRPGNSPAAACVFAIAMPVVERLMRCADRRLVTQGAKAALLALFASMHGAHAATLPLYIPHDASLATILGICGLAESAAAGRDLMVAAASMIPPALVTEDTLAILIRALSNQAGRIVSRCALAGLLALRISALAGRPLVRSPELQCTCFLAEHDVPEAEQDALRKFCVSYCDRNGVLDRSLATGLGLIDLVLDRRGAWQLDILPRALASLCRETTCPLTAYAVVHRLLGELLLSTASLEDSRFDTDTFASRARACIYRCLASVSGYVHNVDVRSTQAAILGALARQGAWPADALEQKLALKVGVLMPLHSKTFTQACDIAPHEYAAEEQRRRQRRFEPLYTPAAPPASPRALALNSRVESIDTFNSESGFSRLLVKSDAIPVSLSAATLATLIYPQVLAECLLNVGLYDFDAAARAAAEDALLALVSAYGSRYAMRIRYLKDANRPELVAGTRPDEASYYVCDRLLREVADLTAAGSYHRLVLDNRAHVDAIRTATLAMLLHAMGAVCASLPWASGHRQACLDALGSVLAVRDATAEQHLVRRTVEAVPLMLTFVDLAFAQGAAEGRSAKGQARPRGRAPARAPAPGASGADADADAGAAAARGSRADQYPTAQAYARDHLLEVFGQTMMTKGAEYPGAAYALAGVAKFLGLSSLVPVGSPAQAQAQAQAASAAPAAPAAKGILTHYAIPCIRADGKRLQHAGLCCLEGLYLAFGRTAEPYNVAILNDVLRFLSDDDPALRRRADALVVLILRSLSTFGVGYVMPSLVAALQEPMYWRETKGAADLIYRICTLDSLSTGLTRAQIRVLISRVLPSAMPLLQPLIYEANAAVARAARRALDSVSFSITVPEVRRLVPRILDSFTSPDLYRALICDLAQIHFTSRLDGSSLTLLVPLCEKALGVGSSVVYPAPAGGAGADPFPGVHTKVIACGCVSIICRISSPRDLGLYCARLKALLRGVLREISPDIRSAAATALSALCKALPDEARALLDELWEGLFTRAALPAAEAHGIAETLASVALNTGAADAVYARLREYYFGTYGFAYEPAYAAQRADAREGLASMFRFSSRLGFLLLLQYVPQRLVDEHPDMVDRFVDTFLQEALAMVFVTTDAGAGAAGAAGAGSVAGGAAADLRPRIARTLATSFADSRPRLRRVAAVIARFILSDSSETRTLCANLVGDIISDLGSVTMDAAAAADPALDDGGASSEQVRQMRGKIAETFRITGNMSQKEKSGLKVFVPEDAVRAAVGKMGQDLYDDLMAYLYVLRLDAASDARIAAMSTWKAVVLRPVQTAAACVPRILAILLRVAGAGAFGRGDAGSARPAAPAGPAGDASFAREELVDACMADLMRTAPEAALQELPGFYVRLLGRPAAEAGDGPGAAPGMDMDAEATVVGSLCCLAALVRHLPPGVTVASEDVVHAIAAHLSSPSARVSRVAAMLFSSLHHSTAQGGRRPRAKGRGAPGVADPSGASAATDAAGAAGASGPNILSAILDPLLDKALTEDSPEASVTALVSICSQQLSLLASVVARCLRLEPAEGADADADAGPLGAREADLVCRLLTTDPSEGYVKTALRCVAACFGRLCDTPARDLLAAEFAADPCASPLLRVIGAGCSVIAQHREANDVYLILKPYCVDLLESAQQSGFAATLLFACAACQNIPTFVLTCSAYNTKLVAAVAAALSTAACAPLVNTLTRALHTLYASPPNAVSAAGALEFLKTVCIHFRAAVQKTLVARQGFLPAVQALVLRSLLDLLLPTFSTKLDVEAPVRYCALEALAMLLLASAQLSRDELRQADADASAGAPDVTRFTYQSIPFALSREKAQRTSRLYISTILGKTILVFSENTPPEFRARLVWVVTLCLRVSPDACKMFELPLRASLLDRRGITAPAAEVRDASVECVVELARMSGKREQIVLALYNQLFTYDPETAALAPLAHASPGAGVGVGVGVSVSVLLCLAAVIPVCTPASLAGVVANTAKPTNVPLTRPLILEVTSAVTSDYLLTTNAAFLGPAAALVAACLASMEDVAAVQETVVLLFGEARDFLLRRAQNLILLHLLRDPSCRGTSHFLSAAKIQEPLSGVRTINWLGERIKLVSDGSEYGLLCAVFAALFVRAATAPLSTVKVMLPVSQQYLCAILELLATQKAAAPLAPGDRAACVEALAAIAGSDVPRDALRGFCVQVTPYVRFFINDKAVVVSSAAEEMFVGLFGLRFGQDFIADVMEAVGVENQALARDMLTYAEMLTKRIKSGKL